MNHISTLTASTSSAVRPWTIGLIFLLGVCVGGCQGVYNALGGNWKQSPHEMPDRISPAAQRLIDKAFADIDEDDVIIDMHVHMISRDVHPTWLLPWNVYRYGRTMVYLNGAGVDHHSPTIKQDYIDRILAQLAYIPRPMRLYLYAMDRTYHPDGRLDSQRTNVYVSNHTVYELSRRYPHVFRPVISLHPYRHDAITKLHYCVSGRPKPATYERLKTSHDQGGFAG